MNNRDWLDIVMDLPNPFDREAAVAMCASEGVSLAFSADTFAIIMGNIYSRMAGGATYRDAYVDLLAKWNTPIKPDIGDTKPCCGGGEIR